MRFERNTLRPPAGLVTLASVALGPVADLQRDGELVEHLWPLRPVDSTEPEKCAGCARCAHRKRKTVRARVRGGRA